MFLVTLLRVWKFSRVANLRFISTYARVKIVSVFWRSVKAICVYWHELVGLFMETGLLVRKLDGLLTETGRIIGGKWVFCWRKQDGLLTETGWSGYGNWMVYWRKLDGQLTGTGRSTDGKSVYWWKQSSRFSSFWGPENAILPSSETLGFVDTWMGNCRKLDGLLMERVVWQQSSSTHFTHFGG